MSDDTHGVGSEPGRRIGDRYELGDLLGRGGMAEVRRAVDTRLNRPVAIKQLRADLATDPTFQARFRREAQAAAGLNHPTIVSVYDTGEEADPLTGVRVPYIVMELVEGVTLRDVLRDGRKILPERALELAAGVLDALSYSHKAGIVHRDIKPANVMLTPAGDVKVMDFGIARAVADTSSTMTQTAAVIGTAQYLSPEQARGETVDARSDIYSAGCLLYELLTGRPPFIGESPVSVAYQHVREEAQPPSQLDPEVTPQMDAVVMRALAKDPNERYQSARQMKDDLYRLLNGQAPIALATMPTSSPTPSEMATTVLVPDHQPSPYGENTRVTEPVALAGAGGELAEQDEDPEKRRTGPIVALIIVLVLALIAAGTALWFVFGPGASPEPPPSSTSASPTVQMVQVPSVIGQTEEQATNQLTGAGLKVKVDQVAGPNDSSVGQVTNQNPPAQQQVAAGTEVTITVNVGPDTGTIPPVTGMSVNDAKSALKKAGFTDVTTQDATDEPPGSKKGTVLSVDPKVGTEAAQDTEITLTVATGKGPIPDLGGLSQERARSTAKEAGFEVEFVTEETDDTSVINTVIKQSPSKDDSADWGTTIKATIAIAKTSPPPSTPGSSGTPGGSESPSGSATPGG